MKFRLAGLSLGFPVGIADIVSYDESHIVSVVLFKILFWILKRLVSDNALGCINSRSKKVNKVHLERLGVPD